MVRDVLLGLVEVVASSVLSCVLDWEASVLDSSYEKLDVSAVLRPVKYEVDETKVTSVDVGCNEVTTVEVTGSEVLNSDDDVTTNEGNSEVLGAKLLTSGLLITELLNTNVLLGASDVLVTGIDVDSGAELVGGIYVELGAKLVLGTSDVVGWRLVDSTRDVVGTSELVGSTVGLTEVRIEERKDDEKVHVGDTLVAVSLPPFDIYFQFRLNREKTVREIYRLVKSVSCASTPCA